MTKQELADKVRAAARDVASRADKPENATPMALKYSDILFKFPKLQETLSQLMSEEFTIFVSEQRLCKDDYEIRELQAAVDATALGFNDVISAIPAAVETPRGERVLDAAF